jgi:hypothetical protein
MLIFKRKRDNNFLDVIDVYRKESGKWIDADHVHAFEDGKWVLVWSRIPGSMNFQRGYGDGVIISRSAGEMILQVQDPVQEFSGTASYQVGAVSMTFKNNRARNASISFYMAEDVHNPRLHISTQGYSSTQQFVSTLKTVAFPLQAGEITLTFEFVFDSSGTVKEHLSQCYLRDLMIDNKYVSFI